ncbi:MAG: type II secretion system secretin GspD [Hydrogenophaga sp.]|nr:type II secretion system secretin GspD [Hydrogenophaga sp.]
MSCARNEVCLLFRNEFSSYYLVTSVYMSTSHHFDRPRVAVAWRPVALACVLFLSACATVAPPPQNAPDTPDAAPAASAVATGLAAPAATVGAEKKPLVNAGRAGQAAAESTERTPIVILGNDKTLAPPKPAMPIAGLTSGLKFEGAALADVVGVVLREIAKVDYIVHPPINGSVTLSTQGAVTPDQAFVLLETALQANGYLLARDARGTYHVGSPDAVKSVVPAVRQAVSGTPLPPGYGAVVVPLRFIGASEMASILRPMVAADAIVRVDNFRNILVLAGTRTQAEGWLDIVNTFDVDVLSGMSLALFPLKHISIQEVQQALQLVGAGVGIPATSTPGVLGAAGASQPAAAGAQSTARAGAAAPAAAGGATTLGSAPVIAGMQVIPIERLNSILVVSPRAAVIEQARSWLEKLDRPGLTSNTPRLFVYPVKYGNATHLANLVSGLFGGSASTAGSIATQSAGTTNVAPGLRSTQLSSSGTGAFGAAATGGSIGFGSASSSSAANTRPGATAPVTSVNLPGGVRVMADEVNNALLIYGLPSDFEIIESAMKRLDLPPTQVLIEATIVEVTLSDDMKYGLQWVFSDKNRGGYSGGGAFTTGGLASTTLNNLGSNVVNNLFGAASGGFTYTLSNALGVRAVLNTLASKSLIKVISSPSLMVLDNHTARIAVGDQQPVRVGETVTSVGTVTSNIQYKDTGVALQVTPSVNASDYVTMSILQSVTDVGAVDDATQQRSFLQRQFDSKVAVKSGETIVLGGLIRDNTTDSNSGLPGLKDVPVLGALFGGTTQASKRTELIVLITPSVARSGQDITMIGEELRQRMNSLRNLPVVNVPGAVR